VKTNNKEKEVERRMQHLEFGQRRKGRRSAGEREREWERVFVLPDKKLSIWKGFSAAKTDEVFRVPHLPDCFNDRGTRRITNQLLAPYFQEGGGIVFKRRACTN
jgi:hypothetical protein